MTMPHLMNCKHSGGGWCVNCVEDLQTKLDLAGEINKSLEIQVGQLGEMNRDLEIQLSDKTKACEAQHEMIKRLEAENAALEQRLV